MASVLTTTEAKGSTKILIKKKWLPYGFGSQRPGAKNPLYGSNLSTTEAEKCLDGLGCQPRPKGPFWPHAQYALGLKPRPNDENN